MVKLLNRNLILLIGGLIIGLLIGAVVIVGFNNNFDPYQSATPSISIDKLTSPFLGLEAPEFELATLSNDQTKLSDFKGKPVILNFWATWCGPCRVEMPILEDLYKTHQTDLAILAVNFDEEAQTVQDFIGEYGLTFPVLLDPGGLVTEKYRVIGMPTTYFLDNKGIVRAVHIGTLSEKSLIDYLNLIRINDD